MLKNCRSQFARHYTDPRGPGSAMPTVGTTSTASPLLIPGLPSDVSSSSAVVVKLNFTRAGHRIVHLVARAARSRPTHIGYMR